MNRQALREFGLMCVYYAVINIVFTRSFSMSKQFISNIWIGVGLRWTLISLRHHSKQSRPGLFPTMPLLRSIFHLFALISLRSWLWHFLSCQGLVIALILPAGKVMCCKPSQRSLRGGSYSQRSTGQRRISGSAAVLWLRAVLHITGATEPSRENERDWYHSWKPAQWMLNVFGHLNHT